MHEAPQDSVDAKPESPHLQHGCAIWRKAKDIYGPNPNSATMTTKASDQQTHVLQFKLKQPLTCEGQQIVQHNAAPHETSTITSASVDGLLDTLPKSHHPAHYDCHGWQEQLLVTNQVQGNEANSMPAELTAVDLTTQHISDMAVPAHSSAATVLSSDTAQIETQPAQQQSAEVLEAVGVCKCKLLPRVDTADSTNPTAPSHASWSSGDDI